MPTETPPKPSPSKRYRLENRDPRRGRWVFELAPAPGSEGGIEEITLGDPADRDIPDRQRTKLTSRPDVELTDEQLGRMLPGSRRTLDALLSRGTVEMRPL